MTEKFIAIAPKGKEFVFKTSTMIAVPTSSAHKIAKTLNNLGYKLKDGETWHVYDNDSYYNDMIARQIKRYSNRNMPVYTYFG